MGSLIDRRWARAAATVLACLALAACTSEPSPDAERNGGSGAVPLPPLSSNGGDGDGSDAGATPGAPAPSSGGAPAAAPADAGAMEPPHVVPPTPEQAEPCDVTGCPPGLDCNADGVCVTPPPDCTADGDCADGQRCGLTGVCLEPGACRVTGDCAMAESCRAEVCTMGSDCGQTELTIEPIPVNVLVLLDISLSMNDALCQGCQTKMQVASSTINQMTVTYATDINWGLAMFPGPDLLNGCANPMNVIAPAPGNGPMVASAVGSAFPGGFTPIYAALSFVQSQGLLSDPMYRNYLLFISDGGETCGGVNADSAQIIANLAAMGVPTFVVGFGDGIDPVVLNDFAMKGGVPNTSGANSYYEANSPAELESALGAIFQRVTGCDFALAGPPDDPDMVWSFFDDVMVEREPDNGWTLDTTENKVTFVGTACDQLQAGTVKDIDIVFGCPEPILE